MNELKKAFLNETAKVILGKELEFEIALCAFLCNGHILIEDIPGVGKTTFAKTLAKVLGLKYQRIQFTSDLLPSDIIGSQVYNNKTQSFEVYKGPIFSEVVLADELNRASPKTQSSMLEAMEEHQVSIDKETFSLPDPFFVIATQNPHTQIGTHLLPESQLDRFMVKLSLGIPHRDNEKKLIMGFDSSSALLNINNIISEENQNKFKKEVLKVNISEKLAVYILDLLTITRNSLKLNSLSPRAGIDIANLSKAYAFLQGRDFVIPDDVKKIIPYAISHRLSLDHNSINEEIIKNVKVD